MEKIPGTPRILVVDDAPAIRMTLREVVKHFVPDAVVTEAQGVSSALDALRTDHVDLVLLDMNLGHGGTGVDLMKAAREVRPETRIVLITALPDDNDLVTEAVSLGLQGHLRKPLRAEDVRVVVQTALGGGTAKRTWTGPQSP